MSKTIVLWLHADSLSLNSAPKAECGIRIEDVDGYRSVVAR